ncbi:MAG: lytic murein transglycosylase B [Azoarcus sp.]|jgi:membrane-bound lytic murein transglycosylase B|nr:lytic murein transglycosylase B [Azoarcus sp.]
MKTPLRPALAALLLSLAMGLAHADYATRTDALAFVEDIAARNRIDPAPIHAALANARHTPRVIDLIKPPETRAARSWRRYRTNAVDRLRIDGGLALWARHADTLRRAEQQYGVPPEIILAILGIETIYGRNTGGFETLSALATLAFDYPPRADLFRNELEALFLLAMEQGRDPASYTGSYAGALGWPQFLPSSVRRYAVDFDGDGRIDFDNGADDAIGSIANYLREYGWQAGALIAIKARLLPGATPAPLIEAGIEPTLGPARLVAAGIRPASGRLPAADAALIDLETPGATTEYWLGYHNFYVITRYNHSSFYAMAVAELARTLRKRHDAPPPKKKTARRRAAKRP